MTTMLSPFNSFAAVLSCAALLLTYIFQRLRHKSLKGLPGPPAESWLVGNLPQLIRPFEVGDADFSWTCDFGSSLRIKGAFGRNILFTADPKALQYVLNTGGYNFPKAPEFRAIIKHVTGPGLSWAEGSQHARQRKIMNPAFSYNSLRVFLPLFQRTAQKTAVKWRDIITSNESSSPVIDIHTWLSRTTLDAIGATAFDYDFGALDEQNNNELSSAYNNLLADLYFEQSDTIIALAAFSALLPGWVISALQLLPSKASMRLRNYMGVARTFAKLLVDRQIRSHAKGLEGGKDIMSILVKANLAENPKDKLSEDDVLSQVTTLMLAGHETTASTVTWALYELSRRPDIQNELREEIKATRAEAEKRGDTELTISDLDSMKLLGATIKETLRFHPILPRLERVAGRDDVIPLSTPLVTKSEKVISEIPITKGQHIILSLPAYNRVKSVWGDDADTWRPKRFLEGLENSQQTNVGVFANIASFSSGVRSCIAWRFAIIEMQALLVEFVENFEYSPPPGNIEIRRAPVTLMTPMIKGSNTGRTELPLTVKCVM